MATRQSIEDCINRCESAILYANEQYTEGRRQEHYRDEEYSSALLGLEEAAIELEKLSDSANDQQREQLYRVRLKLQELQNNMILLNHGVPSYPGFH